MSGKDVQDNYIRVGDTVTLKYFKHQAFLSAEGIVVEDVGVSSSMNFFEDNVFQIYVQRQYSATNELEDFAQTGFDVNDPAVASHIEALLKGKDNEIVLNRSVMKNKIGNILCFGDTIQLLHVKSGKYVTVRPKDLARDERENMKIILSADGSVMSWIKILPRFKINREGEPITNNSDIFLKVSERSSEHVHCAERAPPKGKLREVNSSLEVPTPWKMSLFRRPEDQKFLLTGELVYIRDPESLSAIAPMPKPISVDQDKDGGGGAGRKRAETARTDFSHGDPSLADQAYDDDSVRSHSRQGSFAAGAQHSLDGTVSLDDSRYNEPYDSENESVTSLDEFISDYGEVVLKPIEEDNIDTDAIYVMESRQITRGGKVKFRAEKVRYRHFNTGKYLTVKSNPNAHDSFVLALEKDPPDSSALFSISQLNSADEFLGNSKAMTLKHGYSSLYLERGQYNDRHKVYACGLTRSKGKAVSVIINRYIQKEKFTILKAAEKSPAESVLDIYFAHTVHSLIAWFVKHTVIPRSSRSEAKSIWPRIDATDRTLFSIVLQRATLFVRGYPIHLAPDSEELDGYKIDAYVVTRRQNIFREIGVLQALMVLLNLLGPISDWVIADASTNRLAKGGLVDTARESLSETMNLLYDTIKKNLVNQLYIADFLLVILAHASTDRMAAKVAQELLSSNRELQETKIGVDEVTVFADKMREVPMNSMYLQLLQTCCSCFGQGVAKNQSLVNSIVFDKYRDVLIMFQLDPNSSGSGGSASMKVAVPPPSMAMSKGLSSKGLGNNFNQDNSSNRSNEWDSFSESYELYIGSAPNGNADRAVRGHEAIVSSRSVPQYAVKWISRSVRYSALKLFGKNPVPLTDLFKKFAAPVMMRSSKEVAGKVSGQVISEYKKAVGDYSIAQILLAAEMCLGRNYTVMALLEKMYTYEMMISIMRTSQSDSFKSAAAYLLYNCYVEREPQQVTRLPRLTRVLSEIKTDLTNSSKEVFCVPESVEYNFGLLQQMVAEHLIEVRGKVFPSHSYNYLLLMHRLIEFNFYGRKSKLDHIIGLLVATLDRSTQKLEDKTPGSMRGDTSGGGFGGGGGSARNMLEKQSSGKQSVLRKSMVSSRSLLQDPEFLSNLDEQEQAGILSLGAAAEAVSGKMDAGLLRGNSAKMSLVSGLSGTSVNDSSSLIEDAPTPIAPILLGAIESVHAHIVMIILVLLCFGASLFHVLTASDYGKWFTLMDLGLFAFFVLEYVVHMVLFWMAHGSPKDFFFNLMVQLDLVVIIVYIVEYFVGLPLWFVKTARLTRLVLLIDIYDRRRKEEAARLEAIRNQVFNWVEPERYFKTSEYSMKILVKVVRTLCSVQRNIEDRNLTLLLRNFHTWMSDQNADEKLPPGIFKSVLARADDLSVSNDKNDDIYIDLLMYSSPPLVQATLELLMNHHSSQQVLINNLTKLQLITSAAGEKQYARMEYVLDILKRNADTHEMWGKLETAEHRDIALDMLKYLEELKESCKKPCEQIKFDCSHEVVPAAQNILRNLACFDMCIKVVQLIRTIDPDGLHAECHVHTRKMALAANNLLTWFVLDNEANQQLAFTELDYFIKTVDEKINSHHVIAAIFQNNLSLMESVSKNHITHFTDLICNVGRFPQYLSLMSSVVCVGEKNILVNQYEIIKQISSPENMKKVVLFFVPVTHPDYAKKVRLMSPYMNAKDISVDELPSDLAYHLGLMDLLNNCTVGRSGMTTIEAKVQSMFNFADIVEAMLDPQTLLLARIKMGKFLYNCMIDVETNLPALKDAKCIWDLIISSQDIFTFAKDDLRQMEKNGLQARTSHRQKIEYMLVCLEVIIGYFSLYYDYTIFKAEIGQVAVGVERMTLKEPQANLIIRSLFQKISAVYEMLSPLLTQEHHVLCYKALVALNNAAKERIVLEVEDIHSALLTTEEFVAQGEKEVDPMTHFDAFVSSITKDADIKESADKQFHSLIEKLNGIPLKSSKDGGHTDARFEPLVEKLVAHIRSTVSVVSHGDETIKHIETEATKTGIWVLKIFRTMIENLWGMSIYERDDDGGEEQDEAVADLMKIYNESGMIEMCLDLISKGIDTALQAEALKLLVGMLFKEGGAKDIQVTIYTYLSKTGSDLFFKTVRTMIQNLISWHKWNGVIVLEEGEDPDLPDEIILIRCLQLCCEGHYTPNQNILREQPNNNVSINLLDDVVTYLTILDSIKCRTTSAAEKSVADLVLEVIQGPCEGNQDYFALNTELLETMNRKIRQRVVVDCEEDEELDLKKTYIDIFQALLEGQGRKVAVYERMLSVLHIDVVQVMCTRAGKDDEEEESDESVELRTESLVLLQMLMDFRPSLKVELGIDDKWIKSVSEQVVCIEVVWRGELQRKFFHIPDLCLNLAKSSKDKFIADVKRDSPEDKLYGMLEITKDFHREVLHQQTLKDLNIDVIFSRKVQEMFSWLSFWIAFTINILYLKFYRSEKIECDSDRITTLSYGDGDDIYCDAIYLPYTPYWCCRYLNYALILTSTITLIIYTVVRVPVYYQINLERCKNSFDVILTTAKDPFMLYFTMYVACAMLGLRFHIALTFLPLDFITRSPTTQAVLDAVYTPRKQIFFSLILLSILIYIISFFMFFYNNRVEDFPYLQNTISLWNTFKFFWRHGFPYGSASNFMEMTIDTPRLVADVVFFVISLTMLNILKGITIDTFVELRKKLEKRMKDTTEKCFICGIEKNTFNRTLDRTAFRYHTTRDQNLWNYIYFIIFLWEQDKDDDDGFETYARRCVADGDLIWLPMNKAIRLAEHQEKGDVNSLKFRFRDDLSKSESLITNRTGHFKNQLQSTISRVEKALEYEMDAAMGGGTAGDRRNRANSRMTIRKSGGGTGGGGGALGGLTARSGRSHSDVDEELANGGGGGDVLLPQPPVASGSVVGSRGKKGERLSRQSTMDDMSTIKSGIATPPQQPQQRLSRAGSASDKRQLTSGSATGTSGVNFSSALDADNAIQMHLRVVSITGLHITREQSLNVQVRIVTPYEVSEVAPSVTFNDAPSVTRRFKDVTASPSRFTAKHFKTIAYELKDQSFMSIPSPLVGAGGFEAYKTTLQFDAHNNPSILCHEGTLPAFDLSLLVIKVQILVPDRDDPSKPASMIGGVNIPIVTLLQSADSGGTLEIPFKQRYHKVQKENMRASLVTQQSMSSIKFESEELLPEEHLHQPLYPEYEECMLTLMAVASHKLLKDWQNLSESWNEESE